MSDKAGDLQFLGRLNNIQYLCEGVYEVIYLNIERCIEAHLQEVLVILVKHAQEALLEDRRSERI